MAYRVQVTDKDAKIVDAKQSKTRLLHLLAKPQPYQLKHLADFLEDNDLTFIDPSKSIKLTQDGDIMRYLLNALSAGPAYRVFHFIAPIEVFDFFKAEDYFLLGDVVCGFMGPLQDIPEGSNLQTGDNATVFLTPAYTVSKDVIESIEEFRQGEVQSFKEFQKNISMLMQLGDSEFSREAKRLIYRGQFSALEKLVQDHENEQVLPPEPTDDDNNDQTKRCGDDLGSW